MFSLGNYQDGEGPRLGCHSRVSGPDPGLSPANIVRKNRNGRQQLTRFCGQNTYWPWKILNEVLLQETSCKFLNMPGEAAEEGTDLIYQQGPSFTMLLWKAAESFPGNACLEHCGSRTSGAYVLSRFQSRLTLCDPIDL